MSSSIVVSGLGFRWPDGESVFSGLTTQFGTGVTGLIGVNGSGKSTLLRLLAGELTPAEGAVSSTGEIGYLPQTITLHASRRIDDVLTIAPQRRALSAIESGRGTDADFATVGDDWDVEERTRATLQRLGLGHLDLDRTVGEVSGGESVLLALAALLVRRPRVLLLDEPTNNLDLRARRLVHRVVAEWPGVLVVVTHDRELLNQVGRIADLRDGEVRHYGGNLDAYEETVALEQEAAQRLVRAAEQDLRRQQRELVAAHATLRRRVKYGQKMYEQKREPKIVMGNRKRAAEVSAGKYRIMHEEKLAEAGDRVREAEEALRVDEEIRIALPRTAVPPGREVLTLRSVRLRTGQVVDLDLRGPERIALVGPNGGGKTTLLRTIAGALTPPEGEVSLKVPMRWLPQRLDVLDDARSTLANVAEAAPLAKHQDIRAQLARFLLRGRKVEQPVGTLSGGERFRAALASLLLADPAPQLFLLDEPTNNLDLASVRQLTQALSAYGGTLVVASHDLPFLRQLGITRWLRLDQHLEEVSPMF
ncbi:ATPase subunit of ABC transporter with duplicated ATPase domains [Crossiella equi]|uniref:ATPase subunit of ABC transporter with duplicated ATPase domains n=1 Tax=Crossiella equi TaxID=130796 RepID=A0ABS5A4C2_9PSEU|nr:ATP-binding cassette domain-containing protein [Crossiella equi]MBP2471423.1 ATPase subunit of ABC transporter with duplicated ATPase domains [Crossiella equi]